MPIQGRVNVLELGRVPRARRLTDLRERFTVTRFETARFGTVGLIAADAGATVEVAGSSRFPLMMSVAEPA